MEKKTAQRLLAALIALYIVCFSLLSLERHQRLVTSIFDVGIFDQALYLTAHGESLFLSTRGLHVHGDHFHPILLLFAPLYFIWPSVSLLLIAQTVVIAIGAYPAYRLGRHLGFAEGQSVLVGALYLAHPTVGFLNRFDFHPVSALAPALMFAVLYLEEKKPIAFTISVVAALCCTEAAGFTILALAVTALWVRDKWWALGTFGLGAAGIVGTKLWLRHFNHNESTPYAMLYTNYGTSEVEVVTHLLTHPLQSVAQMATPLNLEYLFYLFAPLLFLPLLAPDRLLPTVPVLLGNLLSWRHAQHRIENHYGAALTAFLIWAAVIGWKRLRDKGASDRWMGGLVLVTAVVSALLGPLGSKHLSRLPERASIPAALEQLGEDKVVVAGNEIGGHLTHREKLFLFPNPFVVAAWGNSPESLVQQGTAEYRPLTRGALRRGMEAVPVDFVVLSKHEFRSEFPLRGGDHDMARKELGRSPLFEKPENVQDDALVWKRKGEP